MIVKSSTKSKLEKTISTHDYLRLFRTKAKTKTKLFLKNDNSFNKPHWKRTELNYILNII